MNASPLYKQKSKLGYFIDFIILNKNYQLCAWQDLLYYECLLDKGRKVLNCMPDETFPT